MTIDIAPGGVTVPAEVLAPLLDLDPAEVPALMRAGEITSLYETGEGEDAGRCRLTFWHGGRRLRLTCAMDGTILSTSRAPVRR
ncbi:DUF6522 family protein [Jannaschia rubra]|uniref:Uncharacterized protein n=1 Tax=Jannaschia rubra TaxID=282197 RepID=A0A0M6XW21_9RHOB|nr:DUF6522 family protein [Jannaschia rubra]CTQ34767.1 hypothetical protein JAN5088_03563 [Jannaschia rubra]SFG70218.1 hypothetical protein SAMN04488517_11174 [Jannaschia rubra]